MTKKSSVKNVNTTKNNEVISQHKINESSEPDQLLCYEANSPTEARKLIKLSTAVESNIIKFMILAKNKTLHALVHQDVRNGSHALERALPEIEQKLKQKSANKVAMSTNDVIFQLVQLNLYIDCKQIIKNIMYYNL